VLSVRLTSQCLCSKGNLCSEDVILKLLLLLLVLPAVVFWIITRFWQLVKHVGILELG